ncbi:MAG: DUF1707 domain-containing protein [Micrococcales bacterium]|nr:DUF1707 domain-containing protein [Micrococcales bacterium]
MAEETFDEVGDGDRAAARAALQRQWELGVFDASEHERRTTAVRHAQTRGELDRALRGARPGSGVTGPVISPFERPRAPVDDAPAIVRATDARGTKGTGDNRTQGLLKLDRTTAGTIVALTPLACFFLVFALQAPWWIFILWFAMPILVYGKDGRDEYRAERHERRSRRHAAKAARHRRRIEEGQ